ncbi:MAG: epoxyqueuosine reductase QueH [Nitrospiraceae bacterium]|nr:epoxyqueuosine reductase QueH [Nitrospiraceae bacterium]
MKILLHVCCANCAVYPLRKLGERGVEVKALWYNPNIHPAQEYLKRLEAVRELERLRKVEIAYRDHYGLVDFLALTAGEGERAEGARCRHCYRMRLYETAETAKKMKADAFTTTLLFSPYQKFDIITAEAAAAESLFNIPFHLEDWREGFREGQRLSRELGFYRQRYCGCIFSEMERFIKKGGPSEEPRAL